MIPDLSPTQLQSPYFPTIPNKREAGVGVGSSASGEFLLYSSVAEAVQGNKDEFLERLEKPAVRIQKDHRQDDGTVAAYTIGHSPVMGVTGYPGTKEGGDAPRLERPGFYSKSLERPLEALGPLSQRTGEGASWGSRNSPGSVEPQLKGSLLEFGTATIESNRKNLVEPGLGVEVETAPTLQTKAAITRQGIGITEPTKVAKGLPNGITNKFANEFTKDFTKDFKGLKVDQGVDPLTLQAIPPTAYPYSSGNTADLTRTAPTNRSGINQKEAELGLAGMDGLFKGSFPMSWPMDSRMLGRFPARESSATIASNAISFAQGGNSAVNEPHEVPPYVATQATSMSLVTPYVDEEFSNEVSWSQRPNSPEISLTGADFLELKDSLTQPMTPSGENAGEKDSSSGRDPTSSTGVRTQASLHHNSQVPQNFMIQSLHPAVLPAPAPLVSPKVLTAHAVPGRMAQLRFTTDTLGGISAEIKNVFLRNQQNTNGGFSEQQTGEIRLRLKPEHLGELRLRIVTHGNEVGLQFSAANESTRQVIEESLHHLKEILSRQQLFLGRVDVGVATQTSSVPSQSGHSGLDLGSGWESGQSNSSNQNLNSSYDHNKSGNSSRDRWENQFQENVRPRNDSARVVTTPSATQGLNRSGSRAWSLTDPVGIASGSGGQGQHGEGTARLNITA